MQAATHHLSVPGWQGTQRQCHRRTEHKQQRSDHPDDQVLLHVPPKVTGRVRQRSGHQRDKQQSTPCQHADDSPAVPAARLSATSPSQHDVAEQEEQQSRQRQHCPGGETARFVMTTVGQQHVRGVHRFSGSSSVRQTSIGAAVRWRSHPPADQQHTEDEEPDIPPCLVFTRSDMMNTENVMVDHTLHQVEYPHPSRIHPQRARDAHIRPREWVTREYNKPRPVSTASQVKV